MSSSRLHASKKVFSPTCAAWPIPVHLRSAPAHSCCSMPARSRLSSGLTRRMSQRTPGEVLIPSAILASAWEQLLPAGKTLDLPALGQIAGGTSGAHWLLALLSLLPGVGFSEEPPAIFWTPDGRKLASDSCVAEPHSSMFHRTDIALRRYLRRGNLVRLVRSCRIFHRRSRSLTKVDHSRVRRAHAAARDRSSRLRVKTGSAAALAYGAGL